MFYRKYVEEALEHAWASGNETAGGPDIPPDDSSVTSLLIYDIFGGEILKTHNRNSWHFYNRIDGERVDFARPGKGKLIQLVLFEDLPSTPDETRNYFAQEDYSSFFIRFVLSFEEVVNLTYQINLTA